MKSYQQMQFYCASEHRAHVKPKLRRLLVSIIYMDFKKGGIYKQHNSCAIQ